MTIQPMTDYRTLTDTGKRAAYYNFGGSLRDLDDPQSIQLWENVKNGSLCAWCWMVPHNCLCSHDDDD